MRPAAGLPLAYVETYGCQMNVADTELMLGVLQGAGYGRTDDPAAADVILLNTCAVREKAEERVFGRAGELGAQGGPAGRGPGRSPAAWPSTSRRRSAARALRRSVVGPDSYRRLPEHLSRVRGGERVRDTVLDRHETYEGLDPARALADGPSTGVSGTSPSSAAATSSARSAWSPTRAGASAARRRARCCARRARWPAAGDREVQLLGQTVNSYRYEDVGFAELLRAVAAVEGLERVRFTSPYPLDFSAEVIAAIAESPKVCKHVHLPLQSASDPVLERMRRGYDYATFRALVADLRAAMPDIAITTDILIGFCDETEEEFAETLRAMDELRFDSAFMFAYSEREGTYAARKMPDTVPEAVKQRRLAEVIAVQRRISGEINAAQVGRRERVLVESPSRRSDREFLARTDTFRSVIVPAGEGVFPGRWWTW